VTEEKQDQVLEHDFDGIQEYDNQLPNWWLAILYGTVVFAFIYWGYFHTLGVGKSPGESYQAELIAAAAAEYARSGGAELTNDLLISMSNSAEGVVTGQQVFEQFCVVCHADKGQGNVGPNLTDDYWIHGGTPMQIHDTVFNGVPEKGMVAWGNQLGPRRVQAVTSFVLTLRGANVPGKAPEGDLFDEAALQKALQGETAPAGEDSLDTAPPETGQEG
jgi:cytochrome c oxidase cbb3-type subunit 3